MWSKLATYFLNKLSDTSIILQMNFTEIKQFLCLSQSPVFYQEVVPGNCKSNTPDRIITKNDLYNHFLWGKKNIMTNNKCLYSSFFIHSRFKLVSDIIEQSGSIKLLVYNGLVDRRNYFFSVRQLLNTGN